MEIFPHFRFYFLLCNSNGFLYCRSGAMLHSGDLVKIELILVVEQETSPLYLCSLSTALQSSSARSASIICSSMLLGSFNARLFSVSSHTSENSLCRSSHWRRFLFLRSICRNSKNNCSDTSSSWCSPCPSLKLIKYLIPLSVDSSPKRVRLSFICHPVFLLPKISGEIPPPPSSPQNNGMYQTLTKFSEASSADGLTSHRWHQSSNAQVGQSPLWNTPAFSAGRFSRYARPP